MKCSSKKVVKQTLCVSGAALKQMILFLTCRDLRKAPGIVLQHKMVSPCGFGVKTLQRSLIYFRTLPWIVSLFGAFSLIFCKEYST